MARAHRIAGSESRTTILLTPPDDDWGVLTEQQQEAATLRSILDDYIRDGGWRSEPQQRRAFYAWKALTGRRGGDW